MSTKGTKIIIAVVVVIAAVVLVLLWQGNDTKNDSQKATPSSSNEQSSDNGNDKQTSKSISRDDAAKIVTDEFGGQVKSVEDDSWQGKDAWEVEVTNSNRGRIEVKVDKQSGTILHWEMDS